MSPSPGVGVGSREPVEVGAAVGSCEEDGFGVCSAGVGDEDLLGVGVGLEVGEGDALGVGVGEELDEGNCDVLDRCSAMAGAAAASTTMTRPASGASTPRNLRNDIDGTS